MQSLIANVENTKPNCRLLFNEIGCMEYSHNETVNDLQLVTRRASELIKLKLTRIYRNSGDKRAIDSSYRDASGSFPCPK